MNRARELLCTGRKGMASRVPSRDRCQRGEQPHGDGVPPNNQPWGLYAAFIKTYNTEWLIERLGYQTPAAARAAAWAEAA